MSRHLESNFIQHRDFATTRQFTAVIRGGISPSAVELLEQRRWLVARDGRMPYLAVNDEHIELDFNNKDALREFRALLKSPTSISPLCKVLAAWRPGEEQHVLEVDLALVFSAMDCQVDGKLEIVAPGKIPVIQANEVEKPLNISRDQVTKQFLGQVSGLPGNDDTTGTSPPFFMVALNSRKDSASEVPGEESPFFLVNDRLDAKLVCKAFSTGEGQALEVIEARKLSRDDREHLNDVRIIFLKHEPVILKSRDDAKGTRLDSIKQQEIPFLRDWIMYEQACMARSSNVREARSTHGIIAREMIGTSGPGYRYRVVWDTTTRNAWYGTGNQLEKVDALCQQDDGGPGRQAQVSHSGDNEILVDFKDRKQPCTTPFSLFPGDDISETAQRERREAALVQLRAGDAGIPNLLQLINEPAKFPKPRARKFAPISRSGFNSKQEEVIGKAMNSPGILLVQGPPGTGKTSVIAEIAAQLLCGSKDGIGSTPRILLVAQGNSAVDHVRRTLERDANIMVYRDFSKQRGEEGYEELREEVKKRRWSIQKRYGNQNLFQQLESAAGFEDRLTHLADELRSANEPGHALSQVSTLATDLKNSMGELQVSAELVTDLGDHVAQALKHLHESDDILPPSITTIAPSFMDRPGPPNEKELLLVAGNLPSNDLLRTEIEGLARMVSKLGPTSPATTQRWQDVKDQLPNPAQEHEDAHDEIDYLEIAILLDKVRFNIFESKDLVMARNPWIAAIHEWERGLEDHLEWRRTSLRFARAIASTCQRSGQASDTADVTYDLAIVDEAAQVGIDVLIPLVRARNIVLVGDHKQLPPYVDNQVIRDVKSGNEMSIRESLFEYLFRHVPRESRITLSHQYRMHESIGEVVSRAFYPETPLEHEYKGDKARERLPEFGIASNFPFAWIDTSDVHADRDLRREKGVDRRSNRNNWELELLEGILGNLVGPGRTPPSLGSLGIICMYKDQLAAVKELLLKSSLDDLRSCITGSSVGSVDSFQGREFDHVIVLTSRIQGNPGFLRSPQRLNVAISRAKRQVIFVADSGLRNTAPPFTQLWNSVHAPDMSGCAVIPSLEFHADES